MFFKEKVIVWLKYFQHTTNYTLYTGTKNNILSTNSSACYVIITQSNIEVINKNYSNYNRKKKVQLIFIVMKTNQIVYLKIIY